jgi:TolB-like protein
MRVFSVVLDEKAEALCTPVIEMPVKAAPSRLPQIAAALVVSVLAIGGLVWWQPWVPDFEPASVEQMALPLPDRPSIAVLPFVNLSDDPGQDYFADGMTEDLITDLSKRSGLFVIARNSVFAYKGRNVDVSKVGRELGVRYVLEGSVRRVGDRVRISAQLIEARSNSHLWADRYDGDLDDIFALQDEVSKHIIDELAVQLSPSEEALPTRKETKSAQAHDAFLKGWAHYLRATPEDYVTAVSILEEAVRLDPDYGRAYAALASLYGDAREKGWQTRLGLTPDDTLEKALAYLEKTREYPTPLGHQVASGFHSFAGRHEEAIAEAESAIALNANNPVGYFARAKALTYAGRPDEAIEMIRKAMRLDPLYPPDYAFHLGMSRFAMGRFDQAAAPLEEARKRVPDHRGALTFLVATYGFLGRPDDVASALDQLKRLAVNAFMNWRLSTTVLEANIWPFKDPADLTRLREGLRLGGMPEFQDEWGLRREDRLAGDEIRRLAFDHTHQGRHPVSGLEFTITRTSDGRFTAQGLWSDTGVSRIVGDRLCNDWTKYGPSCAVIYRNPGGTPGERNEYLLVQRSGAFPFSVTE